MNLHPEIAHKIIHALIEQFYPWVGAAFLLIPPAAILWAVVGFFGMAIMKVFEKAEWLYNEIRWRRIVGLPLRNIFHD